MKNRWRNIFFLCGLVAVAIMLLTFDSDWAHLLEVLSCAGIWFPVILLIWLVVYLMNAWSWSLILNDPSGTKVSFGRVFKLTVSGYALNYVTPLGLLGGEPYRIMELTPQVGGRRAVSSVLLYAMMHICSHFCFWLGSVGLYVALHCVDPEKYALGGWMVAMLSFLTVIFVTVLYFFSLGYRYGFVVKVFGALCRIPVVRRWAVGFLDSHREQLMEVDAQIACLHATRRAPFWGSLFLEIAARAVSALEYWLLIGLLMDGFSFSDSILVMAFSSLFSNLIFFSPMQLGGFEGGLALAAGGLSVPSAYGLYTALIARLRELVWTAVGIILIKIGKNHDKGIAD